ncbi:hypothetical protein UAW_02937 [Enterococcus haemoperoxidus ATCC BAA-382]|uniref:Uncharacterized protein n=1 Tax=Enterococcus haemoperoxidus ATCC BAA-382 TaxID=1158608 RepID=R2SJ51_9ENTE|nr:hypothetical protein [Enterococcus haemoperoxidus]EOH92896.1 hypothetical protein UAW_02937 [Enterococcus haemoperoxidus ATCC BAA-382]EOT61639.1 hypothetical protein I583_00621 [Enterococcus haemoperoxidus ATCC BAA-382]OJG55474.1 hypothetical protein RV06_GL001917 [Enterococcus haemoperoxidus]
MKKNIYLASFSLVLLAGFATYTIYTKTSDTQNSEETKRTNQVIAKETLEASKKKSNERKVDTFSIDLKNADAKKIYETFKDSNVDDIITLLEMDHDDSDRILVSPDGTILTGQIGDENGRKVDSNTDKNSITVKELKDLVLLHKEEIDELAAQNSPQE